MKPGDKVLVEATVTMVGENVLGVAIAGVGSRVENIRVWRQHVQSAPTIYTADDSGAPMEVMAVAVAARAKKAAA